MSSDTQQATYPYYVVAVGASAGGLDSLQQFCQSLPQDLDCTYLIAQHLSPDRDSMIVDLLARHSSLPVEAARDGCEPQINTIYVTPPNTNMLLSEGKLRVQPPPAKQVPKPSINALFRSVAVEVGQKTIGVVMSGTGDDGARGIEAIRAAGGIALAQDSATAKFASMPQAAVRTHCVEAEMAPAKMGDFIEKAVLGKAHPDFDEKSATTKSTISKLLAFLKDERNVSFEQYKKTTLKRRIARRMMASNISELEQYYQLVKEDSGELDLLFNDLLISVTSFYRDQAAFDQLKNYVSKILTTKAKDEAIRVWVAACATGEEVYTVAMLFAELAGGIDKLIERKVSFFATDIDAEALRVARAGRYTLDAIQPLPEHLLNGYFERDGGEFRIIKPLRDLIVFANHNVIQDPPFMRQDLICCRNLLIYFENKLQKKVLQIFHHSLNDDGYLFIGKSETVSQGAELFDSVIHSAKIFKKKKNKKRTTQAFSLSQRANKVEANATRASEPDEGSYLFKDLVNNSFTSALLVTDELQLKHSFGDTEKLLKLRSGEPPSNALDYIHPSYRNRIRSLIYKAQKDNVEASDLSRTSQGAKDHISSLSAIPLRSQARGSSRYLLLTLKESQETRPESPGEADSHRVAELQHELAAAREHLQTVIDQLEASNEQLRAKTDQMDSANQQLQTANEELETANEELESTNEELTTVNEELSIKTNQYEQSSTELNNIKNSIRSPILVLDENFRIRSFNKAAREAFAVERKNDHLTSIVPDFCDPKEIQRSVKEVINTGKVRNLQFDDDSCCYWLEIAPYRHNDNEIDGVVLTFVDRTRARATEKELKRSESKFRSMMEYSPYPKSIKDADGRYIDVSNSFAKLLGLPREEILGKTDFDLFDSATAAMLRANDDEVRAKGMQLQFEEKMVFAGSTRIFHTAKYLLDKKPKPNSMLCSASMDVSALKESEQRALNARAEADRANAAKSEFLANISHEIRTPMNSIQGVLSIFDHNDMSDDERDELMKMLKSSSNDLKDLIDELLDFAKLEAGKVELAQQPFSTKQIFRRASELLLEHGRRKELKCSVVVHDDVPPVLMGDELRLKEIITNLVSNAIKFTQKGSVTITASGEMKTSSKNEASGANDHPSEERQQIFMLRVAVADTGIGIKKEAHEHIFEKYAQAEPSVTRLFGGTGLGLAITKQLVSLMGGRISLESEVGQGSIFSFEVPLPVSTDTVEDPYYLVPQPLQPIFESPEEASNFPLLVVEDNLSNVTVLTHYLQMLGCSYEVEQDAEVAILKTRKNDYAAILLDLQLEEMDGFQFMDLLVRHHQTKNSTPPAVIAVTGHAHPEVKERCFEAGMQKFLTKPLDLHLLRQTLQEVAESLKVTSA